MKKKWFAIIFVLIIIVLIFYVVNVQFAKQTKCLPESQSVYYCSNKSAMLNPMVKPELNIYNCNPEDIIGSVKHFLCPNKFEEEFSFFINEKKVSKEEFHISINEANTTCNGCIVMDVEMVR